MFHILYKTTNLINSKYYIGIHQIEDWLVGDTYLGSGKLLQKAIRKYGKSNFSKETICVCPTREYARQLEKLIVNKELVKNSKCYNLAIGGDGGILGRKITPEHRARLSEVRTRMNREQGHPNKGKRHKPETIERMKRAKRNISLETRVKLGIASRNRSPEANARIAAGLKGQKRSQESRRRMSVAAKVGWKRRKALRQLAQTGLFPLPSGAPIP